MKTIAITGNKCTGKSTLLQYIGQRHFSTLSIEECIKSIATPSVLKSISEVSLHSSKSSKAVFQKIEVDLNSTEENRTKEVLLPLIVKALKRKLLFLSLCGRGAVFVEVPFLYECALEKYFDRVIVVTCGPKTQEERMHQAAVSVKHSELVSSVQMSLSDKRKRCSTVIDNNKNLEETFVQMDSILSHERPISAFFTASLLLILFSAILPTVLSPKHKADIKKAAQHAHKKLGLYLFQIKAFLSKLVQKKK
ncbi:dephospho-CoA kinase [Nematocida sp. AWRm77]|nr:dephospho-CoA kinase [Nematocida sp. AWRm77]